jgi:hypothetical protein
LTKILMVNQEHISPQKIKNKYITLLLNNFKKNLHVQASPF